MIKDPPQDNSAAGQVETEKAPLQAVRASSFSAKAPKRKQIEIFSSALLNVKSKSKIAAFNFKSLLIVVLPPVMLIIFSLFKTPRSEEYTFDMSVRGRCHLWTGIPVVAVAESSVFFGDDSEFHIWSKPVDLERIDSMHEMICSALDMYPLECLKKLKMERIVLGKTPFRMGDFIADGVARVSSNPYRAEIFMGETADEQVFHHEVYHLILLEYGQHIPGRDQEAQCDMFGKALVEKNSVRSPYVDRRVEEMVSEFCPQLNE